MTTVTTYAGKGSQLTVAEVDANFNNLNNNKVETSAVQAIANGGTGATTANAAADALGAFRKGTILGTVSQTSGVPTGAVVETGTNANGTYVRYADGTQICWVKGIVTNASVAAGGFINTSWTPPAAFSGYAVTNGQMTFSTAAGGTGSTLYGVRFGYASDGTNLYLNTGQNSSSVSPSFTLGTNAALSYTFYASSVGRWF